MNTIFFKIILLVSISNFSYASISVMEKAIVRDCDESYCESSVILEDLVSDSTFEGKYFKIVKGKSDDAISLDSDAFLKLKAATAYYHLTKARRYFLSTVKSRYVETMPQVVVRIDIANHFHERGHFAHDNLEPQFNNAVSVQSGKGYPKHGIMPWGNEIWFRPKKEIRVNSNSDEISSLTTSIAQKYHKKSQQGQINSFLSRLVMSIGDGVEFKWSSYEGNLTSFLISESIYYGMKGFGKIMGIRKVKFFIEASLIPEIIYHEYAHIALSDSLALTHSSPVNEGLADYFAISIANNPTIADNIDKYSLATEKDGENSTGYDVKYEDLSYANMDFVMALLWDIKTELGPNTDRLVYGLKSRITTNSNIRHDLLKSLLMACRTHCEKPLEDRYKMLTIFKNRGF